MKLGVIGLSPLNGHPYSFSAIVNGYDKDAFAKTSWGVIYEYLERRQQHEFGFPNVSVTHAWTQDNTETASLCKACCIPTHCEAYEDMVGSVDGVMIARDDYQNHFKISKPFLDVGIPVFIDKPLTLDRDELNFFMSFIRQGKLMSTSGLRFAKELDPIRDEALSLGEIKFISATVLNDYVKYGVHMLDAVSGLFAGRIVSVTRLIAAHEAFSLKFEEGFSMVLSCLGQVAKTFHLSLYGEAGQAHVDLYDNFTAFKRTIAKFIDMIQYGHAPVDPEQVEQTISLLIAGRALEPGQTYYVS